MASPSSHQDRDADRAARGRGRAADRSGHLRRRRRQRRASRRRSRRRSSAARSRWSMACRARRPDGQLDHRHVLRPVLQRHARPPDSPTASPTTSCAISAHRARCTIAAAGRRPPSWSITTRSRSAAGSRSGAQGRHHGDARRGAAQRQCSTAGASARLDLATRYGDMKVSATGFVDASGDAALTWRAGLPAASRPTGRFTARRWSCSRISTRRSSPTRAGSGRAHEGEGDRTMA